MSLKKYLKDPKKYAIMLYGRLMPDTVACNAKYLKKVYRHNTGMKLDLDDPKTYNEKLQWLKLYDRRPEYTDMVDKCEAKKYVAGRVGEEYIIPTYGVWNSFDEVDFDSLPDQFVLKCTHDSGGIVFCTDKAAFDKEKAKEKINIYLKRNYYSQGREWPYKNVPPRIIAEKYMVDESGYELKDYKFFAFDGEVKAMFIATDRNAKTDTCFDFFDKNFNHLPFTNGHPNAAVTPKKPQHYELMVELAEKLSRGLPQARIDFYNINGKVFFGEITFFHWGGFMPFKPEKWDYTFGSWIKLPKKQESEDKNTEN